jgi:hypothetical protein
MFTISYPASLTKPYDLALHAVVIAAEQARKNHADGRKESVCFQFRHLLCAVFTTPSGQLRYQIGPCGKPTRDGKAFHAALTEAEREAQDFKARGERVPCVADVTYCEGHAPIVNLKGRVLLALKNARGYNLYFHVGAVPRGSEGRKDYGGPLVPGPWAYACGRAVCLSASSAIRERDAAEEAAAIVVKNHSLLVIDNVQYRVVVERGEYLTLEFRQDYSAK